jgi:hypothetical protein
LHSTGEGGKAFANQRGRPARRPLCSIAFLSSIASEKQALNSLRFFASSLFALFAVKFLFNTKDAKCFRKETQRKIFNLPALLSPSEQQ